MKTMKFSGLTRVSINAVNDKTQVRFRLEFGGNEPPETVEFDLTAPDAMAILKGLQTFQASQKIPIPSSLRSKGKPSLSVVETEE